MPVPVQVAAGALNFVLGFGAVTASYTMQLIPKTQATQAVLVHFFRLCPPFLLGEGLIELTKLQFTRSLIAVAGSGGLPGTRKAYCASTVELLHRRGWLRRCNAC